MELMQHKRACEDLGHTMWAILSNFGAPEGRRHDGEFHESGRTGLGLDISERMIIAAARGTDSPGLESTLYDATRAG